MDVSSEAKAIGRAKRLHFALEVDFTFDKLESLRAPGRRRIKTREVQTHVTDLVDINAAWMVDRARCRERTHRWTNDVSQSLGACDADGRPRVAALSAFERSRRADEDSEPEQWG